VKFRNPLAKRSTSSVLKLASMDTHGHRHRARFNTRSVLVAKSQGGLVIGISPDQILIEHIERYNSTTRSYDIIVYNGSGMICLEVENIQACDAVVIVGGRSGTLGKFAIAYDQSKTIGVLE